MYQRNRPAKREGEGQIVPGPQALGAPRYFIWGPSHFSCEIFLFFGRNICVFRAKYRNLVWKKLGKVSRKQLKRICPEKFFSLKSCRRGGGGDVILRKKFPEKLGIGGPETNLPRTPEKLSAALQLKKGNPTLACNRGLYITFNHLLFTYQ